MPRQTSRKIFAAFTLLTAAAAGSQAYAETKDGIKAKDAALLAHIRQQLKDAQACLPHDSKGVWTLCTGVRIAAPELKALLSNDFESCLREIRKHGYLPVQGQALAADQGNQPFIHSTKNAETVHSSKQVLFKSGANPVVCFHELLHVIQWTDHDASPLAPLNRAKTEAALNDLLQARVQEVQDREVHHKPVEAARIAKNTQGAIDLFGRYSGIAQWLDEKDVYVTVLDHCAELKCSQEDREIAITNLFVMRDKLPKAYADRIEKQAGEILSHKHSEALKSARAHWKNLEPKDHEQASRLIRLDWPALLKAFGDEGVRLERVEAPASQETGRKTALIPALVLESIPTAPEERDTQLSGSQLKQGFALGKFVCTSDGGRIIVTRNSTAGSLVHEYLHWKQSQSNPEYCPAVTDQPRLEEDFRSGRLPRQEYESKVLLYQAINRLAELDVYGIMADLGSNLSEYERLNNALMLKQYRNETQD